MRRTNHTWAGFAIAAITLVSLVVAGLASSGGGSVPGTPMHLAAPEAPVHRSQSPQPPKPAASPDIDLYRGLGTWVDIYEYSSWAHPEHTVQRMRAHGVRTLYIETSNYKRNRAVKYRTQQARFIEAAHHLGISVVAWYLPGFANIDRDFRRTMAAIHLRTKTGEGYDSFALDIEAPLVRRPGERSRRLLHLSERIRDAVGPSYPLGAIIPSPLGMQRNPTYWPGFPYRGLASIYDVFLPMTYFTWRVSGPVGAHDYTAACIGIVRHETEDPKVPIHEIGGISDESTTAEAHGFVHAVRQRRIVGGSYYAFKGTTIAQWRELRNIPVR